MGNVAFREALENTEIIQSIPDRYISGYRTVVRDLLNVQEGTLEGFVAV